jgi:pimeloyl-ACP methyl ester carboxylesterase
MEKVTPAAIAAACYAMRDRPDRRPLLPRLELPSLVIVGADDTLMPPAEGEAMRKAIAGSRLVAIPGAGHLSNLEAPEAFNQALLEFLGAL